MSRDWFESCGPDSEGAERMKEKVMDNFKVGDLVRIVESDNEYGHGFDVGSVIEVKSVRELWDGIDYECYGKGVAQTVRERDIEPCAPDRTIQLNHQYTSKSGQKWECIAIRGEVAWLVGIFDGVADGAAYMYKLDGSAVCLASGSEKYDIKWEPVVEWRTNTAHLCDDGGSYYMGSGESRKCAGGVTVTIKYPVVDGKPDFTQATVTPV